MADAVARHMPDGKEVLGLTMLLCAGTYVVVSWLGRQRFDLDALLHRDPDALAGTDGRRSWRDRVLGFTREHTQVDRLTALLTVALVLFWFLVFAAGTAWTLFHLARGGSHESMTTAWIRFWHWRIWLMLGSGAFATVVLAWGGIRDLRRLLAQLERAERNDLDDGIVR